MAKLAIIIRDIPAGAGESGVDVDVNLRGGATLDTITTDADGLAIWEMDGNPGVLEMHATIAGREKYRDGTSIDQLGTFFPPDLPAILRVLGNGVIKSYSDWQTAPNDMALAPGVGRTISVATGAIILDGHIYKCTSSTQVAVAANSSGSTRYDRIVARFTREGQGNSSGTFVLAAKTGTSDTAGPALTRSTTMVEYSLGKIRVVDGASSFAGGDITDERYSTTLFQSFVSFNPNAFIESSTGYTSGDILFVNTTGVLTRLPKGTDGQLLKLVSGLPAWASQSFALIVESNDVVLSSAVTTLDFSSKFSLTEVPPGEVNVTIANQAITATQLANGAVGSTQLANGAVGNTQLSSGIAATKLADGSVDDTEFQYLNGATSNIQTQLNGKSATTHTHVGNPTLADSAVNDYYSPINVTTAGQDICSVSLTLLNGVTYDCICDADMQGSAPPSGGTYIQAFALIATGSSAPGAKAAVPTGERWIGARQVKTIVGTGAAVTFKARANTDGGTGVVNGAIVRATAIPRNIPAS